MDNSSARQSQLSRFNLGAYGDQQIQVNQLRSSSICIHYIVSVRYKYTFPNPEGTHHTSSFSLSVHHHITLTVSLCPVLNPFHLLILTPESLRPALH